MAALPLILVLLGAIVLRLLLILLHWTDLGRLWDDLDRRGIRFQLARALDLVTFLAFAGFAFYALWDLQGQAGFWQRYGTAFVFGGADPPLRPPHHRGDFGSGHDGADGAVFLDEELIPTGGSFVARAGSFCIAWEAAFHHSLWRVESDLMQSPIVSILFAVFLAGCLPGSLRAGPDFSQSSIAVSSEAPLEADLVRFTLHLKNSGDALADPAQLEIEWPLMGFFAGVEGLEEFQIDEGARKITASLSLPPSSAKTVMVDVLAPRDSGGDALTVAVHLAHFFSGTEHWDRKTVTIDTRLPGSEDGRSGGVRILSAGWWVLAWFVIAVLIWGFVCLRMRGREKSRVGSIGVAACLAIPVGFWMVFAAMAWRDYEVLVNWTETTAMIVGRRDKTQTVTSSRRSSSGSSVSSQSEIVSPEFALRYEVDGKTIHSTGYDTGSSIRVGGRVRREVEMRNWVRGATIPCWYDPDDPRDVVVRRGFGGAYVFALIPLPIFLIGLHLMRRGAAR